MAYLQNDGVATAEDGGQMSIIPFILLENQRRILNNDYEQRRRSYSPVPKKHTFCCEYCGFEFETDSNIVTTTCRNCGRITNWYGSKYELRR